MKRKDADFERALGAEDEDEKTKKKKSGSGEGNGGSSSLLRASREQVLNVMRKKKKRNKKSRNETRRRKKRLKTLIATKSVRLMRRETGTKKVQMMI